MLGLKDRHTKNLDIILALSEEEVFFIVVNGKEEKKIEDSSMTK